MILCIQAAVLVAFSTGSNFPDIFCMYTVQRTILPRVSHKDDTVKMTLNSSNMTITILIKFFALNLVLIWLF